MTGTIISQYFCTCWQRLFGKCQHLQYSTICQLVLIFLLWKLERISWLPVSEDGPSSCKLIAVGVKEMVNEKGCRWGGGLPSSGGAYDGGQCLSLQLSSCLRSHTETHKPRRINKMTPKAPNNIILSWRPVFSCAVAAWPSGDEKKATLSQIRTRVRGKASHLSGSCGEPRS